MTPAMNSMHTQPTMITAAARPRSRSRKHERVCELEAGAAIFE
jgi:hypothetical protein